MQGRRFVVLDVHADLRTTGFRQEQSECAHTGEAATLLPHHCGDCPRDLHIVGGEVHVERDQQPARADDDSTGALIESRRTEVRVKLARLDSTLELRRASAPVERGAPLRCGVAVEEHREAKLVANPIREPQRTVPRPLAVAGSERDDRHDVCGAYSGMSAFVLAQVDALARAGDSCQEALDERGVVADQREDRPVVIGVRVDVEHVGVAGQGGPQRLDRPGVTAFREVRHRLEWQLHRAYSTKV